VSDETEEIDEIEDTDDSDEAEPVETLPPQLGPEILSALARKGYATLTPVQNAVLAPAADGRDLRITSQTGSGKTLAIGFVLRALATTPEPRSDGKVVARPRALIITPTRELGRQVEEELGWLYAPLGARVVAVTGGTSYRDEHRALSARPSILVGTPGRLIDHLEHGSLDPTAITAVVLDEADRMLDMGFSEALETILAKIPDGRRTHLVSATFPPEVRRLADRVQTTPLHVEGTRLGAANADIQHVLVLVDHGQRLDALVNILLAHEGSRTLVFSRTRAGVSEIADALGDAGFAVASISGEMAQNERTRALAAFKRGSLRILVATDVAARGIDVSDVGLVLHMEPPTDPDSYTHRSGRTGRAGKKGTSAVLVAPRELSRAHRVLARANVRFRIEPLPTAASIRLRQDDHLIELLTDETSETELDPRTASLAARLAAAPNVERTIARLLVESGITRGPEPRDVRLIAPPSDERRSRDDRGPRARRDMDAAGPRRPPPRGRPEGSTEFQPREDAVRAERSDTPNRFDAPRPAAPRSDSGQQSEGFALFQVSWGERQGADARRLLAMVCRRGEIESRDVGAIRIGPASSSVEVRVEMAERFAAAAMRPDPRDPRVRVRPAPSEQPRPPRRPVPRQDAPRREGGGAPPRRRPPQG
jgi:ATP-dependent RNA helicase DeaD